MLSKERCKAHTNVRRCFVVFEGGGGVVMVCIRPERFPKGTYKKLHSKNVGPGKIVKNTSSNASP